MNTATKQCNEVQPLSNKELIINQILSIKEAFELLTNSSHSQSDKELLAQLRSSLKAFFSDKFIDDLGLLDDYKIVNNKSSGLSFIPALSLDSNLEKFRTKIFIGKVEDAEGKPALRITLNLPEWDHPDCCFDIPSDTDFSTRQQYLISAIGEFLAMTSIR